MIRKLYLLSFVIICCFQVNMFAQNSKSGRVNFYEYNELQKRQQIQSFTALILRSGSAVDFSDFAFRSSGQLINFENDPHTNPVQDYFYSAIIHLEKPEDQIELVSMANSPQNLTVIAVNGSYSFQSNQITKARAANNCEQPALVSQNEWRSGLQAPSYDRIYTETGNIIIHHSAGNNNITDYLQAVRDIYLFHTEGRGWSDIGYNYLVAPDGVIFAGRDPGPGAQDLVMGAHFCGSNSNTMGICVLGNYEEVEPTSASLESLNSLLSWKINKDSLNPVGNTFHPLNSNLAVIAGHRNGCSTLCPGENLYARLSEIRLEVDSISSNCADDTDDGDNGEGGEPSTPEVEENDDETFVPIIVDKNNYEEVPNYTIFPNPVTKPLQFRIKLDQNLQAELENLQMRSTDGKRIFVRINKAKRYISILPNLLIESGIYYLYLTFDDGSTVTKKVLIR